jgi:hypothetical protein
LKLVACRSIFPLPVVVGDHFYAYLFMQQFQFAPPGQIAACPSIENVDPCGAQAGFARLPREVSGGTGNAHLLQPLDAADPRVDRTGKDLSIAPRCRPHIDADNFPGRMSIGARRHSPNFLSSSRGFRRSKRVSGGPPIALSSLPFEKT